MSHTQQQIQEKTNIVAECPALLIGLNIPKEKSKILTVNSTSTASVTLGEEAIEQVEHLTYLAASLTHRVGQKHTLKPGSARQVSLSSAQEHLEIQSPFTEK